MFVCGGGISISQETMAAQQKLLKFTGTAHVKQCMWGKYLVPYRPVSLPSLRLSEDKRGNMAEAEWETQSDFKA